MHTIDLPQAGTAAPISPARVSTIDVPAYYAAHKLPALDRWEPEISVDAIGAGKNGPAQVCLSASGAGFVVYRRMTPAEARQLAVYLVDSANALDNPADRVIVDEAEGIGHE